MALKYPISLHELIHIHGVGEKPKYGADFVELISQYVIDNEILRPDDLVVKSTGIKSAIKLYIIKM
jgi:ATP-dependent DNA helicase RecQ